ncbi:hypothetical protein LTR17_007534 [Elasticomyces elasticus]|nr:hypothetical protein LTR17_007534 [Elasticomyces elasticus]
MDVADLPTELLELTAHYLIHHRGFKHVSDMLAFRLVCRAITSETHETFARAAFKSLIVDMSSRSLNLLKSIAEHPAFGVKVEQLKFYDEDSAYSPQGYLAFLAKARSGDLDVEEQAGVEEFLNFVGAEQEDKAFLQRTASDGIILFVCFQRMRSLRKIDIPAIWRSGRPQGSVRRHLTGNGESTTRAYSTIVSCLAYAQQRPKELLTDWDGCTTCSEGVAVQALYMTPEIKLCIAGLQRLELLLDISDEHFKNQTLWHSYLAALLCTTPELRKLKLGFCRDWEDIAHVFAPVANTIHLPHLQDLDLQHIRCDGAALYSFLLRHHGITRLSLTNLQVTGSTSFAQMLGALGDTFEHLIFFECRQIAQNDFRLEFETLGIVTWNDTWAPHDNNQADKDLLNSFVSVRKPDKYTVRVEQWEGVQSRIKLFREDLRLSSKPCEPDIPPGSIHGDYVWLP